MKISDIKDVSSQMVQQYQKNDNYVANTEKQATYATTKTEEKVDLSTQAKDIQLAKNALSQLSDVREQKVQEIKSQVDNGKYNVSGEKIAGKMVEESIVDLFA
ncbi:MAG: flagellar biosynthesis anti-sigma factor FlgM [Deltaproteobacteria bacterium HGW-Deltaproteobacteria-10]|nr:MAG: flagellar biosynthesis anti-sigma factor FlgM [Deltaproteobacteria bacterium HGW-Deltaproteobacteria-10]